MNPYAPRTHEEMKDVLYDQSAPGPAIHYHMIRGGSEKSNITIWEPGTVGTEYIKAYGHYHVDGIPEIYKIVQGTGILLLQKRVVENGTAQDNTLASIKAISVKAGDTVTIAGDEGHTLINTGSTWLVTVDNSPIAGTSAAEISKPSHADYAPMKKLRGMGYYVVKGKDGKPKFVKNSRYEVVPDIQIK